MTTLVGMKRKAREAVDIEEDEDDKDDHTHAPPPPPLGHDFATLFRTLPHEHDLVRFFDNKVNRGAALAITLTGALLCLWGQCLVHCTRIPRVYQGNQVLYNYSQVWKCRPHKLKYQFGIASEEGEILFLFFFCWLSQHLAALLVHSRWKGIQLASEVASIPETLQVMEPPTVILICMKSGDLGEPGESKVGDNQEGIARQYREFGGLVGRQ